jgi:predicted GNAT family N-acyltransferase
MRIVLLSRRHHKNSFQCEENSLNDYLLKQAFQDIRKKLAVCFVAVDQMDRVLGYYTLSSESLGRDLIPKKYLNRIPKNYNAPVVLLGRLARDLKAKGSGLGEELLIDALFRSYSLSEQSIGAMAVIVDPISDSARSFYYKYGFIALKDSSKMFLPMNTIKKLI